MWDNLEDCRSQLVGTIVRKNKAPVTVTDVSGTGKKDWVVSYTTLRSGSRNRCQISDLNLSPVPLGYVNHGSHSSYTVRVPKRRWKHGVDQGNIRGINRPFRLDAISSRGLASTIMGDFPSFAESISIVVAKGNSSAAFNRNFSVQKDNEGGWPLVPLVLCYKGKIVGDIDSSTKDISLRGPYKYLKEQLQEALL